MGRPCTLCLHPQRAEINAALAARNESYTRVAARYGLTPSATKRHSNLHLPKSLAQAAAKREALTVERVLDRISDDIAFTERMRNGSWPKDPKQAILAQRELTRLYMLLLQRSGRESVQVVVNPPQAMGAEVDRAELIRQCKLILEFEEDEARDRAALTQEAPDGSPHE